MGLKTKYQPVIWRGHHGEFMDVLYRADQDNDMLIVCPPYLSPTWEKQYGSKLEIEKPTELTVGIFTSGTSARESKIIFLNRHNIQACLTSIFELFDQQHIKKIFCYPQPYHVFGLVLGYAQCLWNQSQKLIIESGPYSSRTHEKWLQTVDESTLTLWTPTHLRDLVHYVRTNDLKARVHASYSCILGGARVNLSDWLDARDVLQVLQPSIGYGCTEASPGLTHLPPGLKPLFDGDIGFPLGCVRWESSLTEEGFWFSGDNAAQLSLGPDGFRKHDRHFVPDHIELDVPSQRIRFHGRHDATLNRGAEKFHFESIESTLQNKLGIRAGASSRRDARLGEELCLVFQQSPNPPKIITAAHITDELFNCFGRRFNEELIREVKLIPTTPQGKIDRRWITESFEN